MRLIDADAFIRFLAEQKVKETGAFTKGLNKALNVAISAQKNLQITPTVDAVPVVRCRDCKYLYTDEYGFLVCVESGAMLDPEDDDYCSRGQRRDQFAGGGKTGGQNDADQH